MSKANNDRVNATGTHSAVIDIKATSAEEAAEIATKLDAEKFDVLHTHPGELIIHEVQWVPEADQSGTKDSDASSNDPIP